MKLNQIRDNAGARSSRKRVGRGAGSGLGKTAGVGQKGQKSRTGVAINGFEGGQMPIYRRLPKRGFNNIFRKRYRVVNLGRVQKAVDAKKLDAGKTVDAAALIAAGLIKSARDGVRLLAKGEINAKITFEVAGASQAAIEAVEKAGGKVIVPAKPEAAAEA
jgi:large subunit ribosomal protein L15